MTHTRSFKSFLFELVIIALGVGLGLAANEYHEALKDARLADRALRTLRTEISENLAAFENNVTGHRAYGEYLNGFRDDDAPLRATRLGFAEIHMNQGGMGFAVPGLGAWQTAQAVGATQHIDFDLNARLSHIHERELLVQQRVKLLLENLYVPELWLPEMAVPFAGSMAIMLNDLIRDEDRLIRMYREVLPLLDEQIGDGVVSLPEETTSADAPRSSTTPESE